MEIKQGDVVIWGASGCSKGKVVRVLDENKEVWLTPRDGGYMFSVPISEIKEIEKLTSAESC